MRDVVGNWVQPKKYECSPCYGCALLTRHLWYTSSKKKTCVLHDMIHTLCDMYDISS